MEQNHNIAEESFVCIACSSARSKEVIKGDFTRLGWAIPFAVVACASCGLGQTVPKPRVGHEGSAEGYVAEAETDPEADLALNTWSASMVKSFVSHYRAGDLTEKVFLDVGCNLGAALDAARSHGYQTIGVEVYDKSADFASKRHTVYRQFIEEVPLESESVDLILMSHTLEHIEDPVAALRACFRLLKRGGMLSIYVPNYTGVLPKIMKTNWMGWYANQHYWHYTAESMKRLAQEAGSFEVVASNTRGSAEPRSLGLKGKLKTLTAKVGGMVGAGDELQMVLRKM